jgi:hypothetical protein
MGSVRYEIDLRSVFFFFLRFLGCCDVMMETLAIFFLI